jgi:DNA polymerase III delta prime subunit
MLTLLFRRRIMKSETHVRVSSSKHEKMKEIVRMKGSRRTIFEEYDLAISNHIQNAYQENLIESSNIENILDRKFKAMDKHLSSMLGKNGMTDSMVLVGMIKFLSSYFKIEPDEIIEVLRKEGRIYYRGE